MVSQTIFQGLVCNQYAEGEWWLAVDLQIRCSSDWPHSPVYWRCALFTALIPIGLPIAMFAVLYRERLELQTTQSSARRKYSFLVGSYRHKFWYWQVTYRASQL